MIDTMHLLGQAVPRLLLSHDSTHPSSTTTISSNFLFLQQEKTDESLKFSLRDSVSIISFSCRLKCETLRQRRSNAGTTSETLSPALDQRGQVLTGNYTCCIWCAPDSNDEYNAHQSDGNDLSRQRLDLEIHPC